MATRGFLSPRRSRPGATEQGGSDERKNQYKMNHRSSTISSLNPSKSPSTENLQQEVAASNKKGIFSSKSAPESALNSATPAPTRRTTKKGKVKDDGGKSIHKSKPQGIMG
ncbi:uncharacterized protein LOC120082755 isoform X2 [Benincasa hispida]|uniref:uncharacterized protein LOC120082755 isoform X2 n=1 Tax=Benincasa hispida TaxID=102211 RepID=UPI001901081B|nr:uncharacterized protein LOC120082755 isoform X2 [Benincasa hispida]